MELATADTFSKVDQPIELYNLLLRIFQTFFFRKMEEHNAPVEIGRVEKGASNSVAHLRAHHGQERCSDAAACARSGGV